MKNFKIYSTLLFFSFVMYTSSIYSQSGLDVKHSSTAVNPTAVFSETGKNNFTRLYLKNDSTANEFRITSRAFAADTPDNNFNLSYYDGSTSTAFLKYSAESNNMELNANSIITAIASNVDPTLLLTDEIDNNFTRLHFRNTNNASNRFSLAANLGTTADNTMGFYYNGIGRIIYNETTSNLQITGTSEIKAGSTMTEPTLLLNETLDNNPARIFFRNTNNIGEQWSIAAQNGSASIPLIGFYYNSTPRLVYLETSSTLEVTGNVDVSSTLNVSGNATFEGNVKIENFLQLEPLTVAPSCAAGGIHNGRVYFDSTTNKARVCVNGTWDNLN